MTTMTKKTLSYAVADFVATLTINQPPVNTLTHDLLREVDLTMDTLRADVAV